MSNGKLDNVAVKAVKDFNRIRREFQLSQAPPPPDPPKIDKLENGKAGEINLTWTYEPATKEDSFDIERRQGTADFAVVGQAVVGTRKHVDTKVDKGTAYQYRVRAIHIAGDSVSEARSITAT